MSSGHARGGPGLRTTPACATLGEVLSRLRVRRMVVGHTVQQEGISSGCDERVWRIDVGMAASYGGRVQVLEIRGDRVRAIAARNDRPG
jgi:hypothetical protein